MVHFTFKPGFHMIATIAVIAAIAEKKKFSDRSDHMENTLQRSQRQQSLRQKKFLLSDCVAAIAVIAAIAGEWFPCDRYERCDR